jgi:hypothetical protein
VGGGGRWRDPAAAASLGEGSGRRCCRLSRRRGSSLAAAILGRSPSFLDEWMRARPHEARLQFGPPLRYSFPDASPSWARLGCAPGQLMKYSLEFFFTPRAMARVAWGPAPSLALMLITVSKKNTLNRLSGQFGAFVRGKENIANATKQTKRRVIRRTTRETLERNATL